jgi:hypothetical protein
MDIPPPTVEPCASPIVPDPDMPVIREKYDFLLAIETVPLALPADFMENVKVEEMRALRMEWKANFLGPHWKKINPIYLELKQIIWKKDGGQK